MGVLLKPVDFHRLLAESPYPPIIVNDLDVNYREDEEKLSRLLLTNYSGPTYSMEPSCDCGKEHGGDKRGKICKECGTKVLPHTEKAIYPELWLRVPDGVHAFMSPYVYAVLSQAFKTQKVDVLQWLIDPNYVGQFDRLPIIQYLKENNIRRGLNYFFENFKMIIEVLLDYKAYNSKDMRTDVMSFLEICDGILFTQYLPIPNKINFVTEKSPTGKYAEMKSIGTAIDAVNNITSLKTKLRAPTMQVKENVATKVILNLASFYRRMISDSHSGKYGMWRKHIFGSRMPFTARAVISSIVGEHDYDEIHYPWGAAVAKFKLHIANYLYKRNYTTNEALAKISKAIKVFDQEIYDILEDMIKKSPHRTSLTGKPGIPIIFNRNPSLLYGSIQLFYITKISKDVTNPSISFSTICFNPLNADLDGDEMSAMLVSDYYMYKSLSRLGTYGSIFDMNKPWGEMNNGIAISKQLGGMVSLWLDKASRSPKVDLNG